MRFYNITYHVSGLISAIMFFLFILFAGLNIMYVALAAFLFFLVFGIIFLKFLILPPIRSNKKGVKIKGEFIKWDDIDEIKIRNKKGSLKGYYDVIIILRNHEVIAEKNIAKAEKLLIEFEKYKEFVNKN